MTGTVLRVVFAVSITQGRSHPPSPSVPWWLCSDKLLVPLSSLDAFQVSGDGILPPSGLLRCWTSCARDFYQEVTLCLSSAWNQRG